MNETKLYVIFAICNCLMILGFVAGITLCAIQFDRAAILWWYILPACFMGMEIKSNKNNDNDKEENQK